MSNWSHSSIIGAPLPLLITFEESIGLFLQGKDNGSRLKEQNLLEG